MWDHLLWQLQRNPVATGIVGTASSLSASALSFFQHLDLIIRVAGGLLGLAIAVVTLAIQVRALRSKQK